MRGTDDISQELIDAAVLLLAKEGSGSVTVRGVAQAAGVSTMAVYSRYGDMAKLLDAVFVRGFVGLEHAMRAAPGSGGDLEHLQAIGLAYRHFALSNPALFSLMFERPIPGFDPSPEVRVATREASFGVLADALRKGQENGTLPAGDVRELGLLIWVGVHGISALEATYASRSSLDEWFINSDEQGQAAIRSIVATTIAGLRARTHSGPSEDA